MKLLSLSGFLFLSLFLPLSTPLPSSPDRGVFNEPFLVVTWNYCHYCFQYFLPSSTSLPSSPDRGVFNETVLVVTWNHCHYHYHYCHRHVHHCHHPHQTKDFLTSQFWSWLEGLAFSLQPSLHCMIAPPNLLMMIAMLVIMLFTLHSLFVIVNKNNFWHWYDISDILLLSYLMTIFWYQFGTLRIKPLHKN